MALLPRVLPLWVLPLLLLSDQGVLQARKGLKRWMSDLSGEIDLDSGIESKRGSETGIETGIEIETEALEAGGVRLVIEGGEVAATKWMRETGSPVGRKMEATVEEDGRETEKEIAIETAIGIGTEIDEIGGSGEAAWTETDRKSVV